MTGKRTTCVCTVVALALIAVPVLGGGKALRKKQKAIAAKLVENVARVKAKDLVIVGGNVDDMDLIEDIAIEVTKKGADPLPIAGRDTYMKRYYDEVPAERDADPKAFMLKLVEATDVMINIGRNNNPALLKNVPAERLAKYGESFRPAMELLHKRGVRRIYLGNGLYPTRATAKQYGISLKKLEQLFWSGLDVDYPKLQATADKMKGILEKGKQIHVTHSNGTDLKFGIEKQPVKVSDGVISDEDVKVGGSATMVWLPAGEVMIVPVPGTAEGKIVFERFPYQDSEIRNMVLTFKGGKLESVTAKQNSAFKRWKEFYDAAKDEGKGDFSWINFGLNPNVKIPKGSKLVNWVPAGMVSCGTGNNQFIGGQNTSQFGSNGFVQGSTVKVDDKVIVEKGQLKI